MEDLELVKRDVEERIGQLREELNYNPWFFLEWRTNHVNKQTAYTQAQAAKITAWVNTQQQLTLLKERYDHTLQLEQKTFEAQIESAIALVEAQKLNTKLIGMANEMGIDLVNYGLVRKEQLMNDVLIDRKKRESDVDVEKHRQLKEIDFQYLTDETQLKLKAALAYQQLNIEQVNFFLGKILEKVQQRHALQFSGEPIQLIEPQLKVINMVITGWEVKLGRLLQGDNEADLGGSDEDSFGGGESPKGLGAGQIQEGATDAGD